MLSTELIVLDSKLPRSSASTSEKSEKFPCVLKVSVCRVPRGRREASGRLSSSESEESEEKICSASLVGDAASII